MATNLTRDDFKLESVSFELRYPHAFALWDRAGAAANAIRSSWDTVKLTDAKPGRVAFNVGREYEIAFELEKALLVGHRPAPHMRDFANAAKTLVSVIVEWLQVDGFSRVGLRFTYVKVYEDIESATTAWLSTGVASAPPGRYFGHQGVPMSGSASFRWETKDTGVRVLLKTEGKRLTFDPAPSIEELQPISQEKYRLVYDVDLYTVAKVQGSQFRAQDWIERMVHMVHRDSKYFLHRGSHE